MQITNKAIYIKNKNQKRNFCALCKEIDICVAKASQDFDYPFYEGIFTTDTGVYAIPIQYIEGTKYSVRGLNHVIITMDSFEKFVKERKENGIQFCK